MFDNGYSGVGPARSEQLILPIEVIADDDEPRLTCDEFIRLDEDTNTNLTNCSIWNEADHSTKLLLLSIDVGNGEIFLAEKSSIHSLTYVTSSLIRVNATMDAINENFAYMVYTPPPHWNEYDKDYDYMDIMISDGNTFDQ